MGVKIQVEGMTARQTEPAHGVEPAVHQLRIAGRGDPQLYSVKNDRLGMTFKPAKRANPWSKTTLMMSWFTVNWNFARLALLSGK